MGMAQIGICVCNDGNVAQLDCADTTPGGRHYRIEVYRASQPSGGFGITNSGSRVEHICGAEHLGPRSNKIFRYFFAVNSSDASPSTKNEMTITLEGREELTPPGMPEGSWDVRLRDLDVNSPTYGAVARATIAPKSEPGQYDLGYEFRLASSDIKKVQVISPLAAGVTKLNPDLTDLGDDERLPAKVMLSQNTLSKISGGEASNTSRAASVALAMRRKDVDSVLRSDIEIISHPHLKKFRENLDEYEEFGDFGLKAIHPGTNLTGPNARLAAESIFVRQYRAALILFGRLSSPGMADGAATPAILGSLRKQTRPGVYHVFIGAAMSHMGVFKLGLDKVHSDYGGIPMKLAPGSRLENDASPVVDSWRGNQTLGEIANIFYLADAPGTY